jgi:hypothetical protein
VPRHENEVRLRSGARHLTTGQRPVRGGVNGELTAQGAQLLKTRCSITHYCSNADHLPGAGSPHDINSFPSGVYLWTRELP